MLYKKLTLFLVAMINVIFVFSQNTYTSPYKYYTYIGGSACLWYKSEQPLMERNMRPWHIFASVGKHDGHWALRADIQVGQQFKQDFVLLNSYFATLALELNTRKILPKPYGAFIYSGPNVWYSTLVFENTNYKEQDYNWGFDIAVGAFYKPARNLKVSSYFLYESSAYGAWFYAGNINLQNVGVGSYQFLFSVSYNLF